MIGHGQRYYSGCGKWRLRLSQEALARDRPARALPRQADRDGRGRRPRPAIGETRLTRPAPSSSSSTPTTVTVFSEPSAGAERTGAPNKTRLRLRGGCGGAPENWGAARPWGGDAGGLPA